MRAAIVILCIGAGLMAAAWQRQAVDLVANAQPEDLQADDDGGALQLGTDSAGWTDQAAQAVDQVNPFALMDQATVTANASDTNVRAFLDMISFSEGTDRASDPYAVCYAYRYTVTDFSRHPAEWYTDESGNKVRDWAGESLANLGPAYAGKVSTAAGRYQIIRPTWRGCAQALGLGDFTPASQDAAALYLIRQRGALELVKAGQFDQAVALCAPEWASLPGANAPGQAMRRLDSLRTAYVNAGGNLA